MKDGRKRVFVWSESVRWDKHESVPIIAVWVALFSICCLQTPVGSQCCRSVMSYEISTLDPKAPMLMFWYQEDIVRVRERKDVKGWCSTPLTCLRCRFVTASVTIWHVFNPFPWFTFCLRMSNLLSWPQRLRLWLADPSKHTWKRENSITDFF